MCGLIASGHDYTCATKRLTYKAQLSIACDYPDQQTQHSLSTSATRMICRLYVRYILWNIGPMYILRTVMPRARNGLKVVLRVFDVQYPGKNILSTSGGSSAVNFPILSRADGPHRHSYRKRQDVRHGHGIIGVYDQSKLGPWVLAAAV